ncbi:chitinase [Synchytrium microbalum]|uniref:Chitinase n=1 Tax=Synchytrium microbalum TaxID=1806994 RepID=A0A507C693_9FUNG|nr:chitinase [Synchytrium microbalum]TPX33584.1 chitinase [Synchytrium microbalum]
MPVVVGYFANWKIYATPPYNPSDIPLEKLTHINYAFGKLDPSGTVSFSDPWADIQMDFPGDAANQPVKGCIHQLTTVLKSRNPNIKIILSVGGWTGSGCFSSVAADPAKRQNFVTSAGELLIAYHIDGLDIDWEFPVEGGMDTNERSVLDSKHFNFLLYELRIHFNQLLTAGRVPHHLELTIATSASSYIYKHLDLPGLLPYVDFINLMSYDYSGSWSPTAGHHSALYTPTPSTPDTISTDATIRDYIARGVPPNKLVLGIGFYGRGFSGVQSPAFNCPHGGASKAASGEDVYTYDECKALVSQNAGWEVIQDGPSASSVLYNRSSATWIGYEDVR